MDIVADSNYCIALSSSNDELYHKAEEIAKLIRKRREKLYINQLVFSEIVTVLSQRVGVVIARGIGNQLLNDNSAIEIIPTNIYSFQRTWDIFHKVQQKDISFTDCSLLALQEEVKAGALLTFDLKDFNKLQKIYPFHYYT